MAKEKMLARNAGVISRKAVGRLTVLAMALALCSGWAQAGGADLKLWFDKPATDWASGALPIGNGRLGAKLFGHPQTEHIQFNEDSLWIGDEKDTGAYQAFGDLYLQFDHRDAKEYRRELDLERAVHSVSYTCGGIAYRREGFASHPSGVLVFRFTADRPGALSGRIWLTDAHKARISAEGNRLLARGNLAGFKYRKYTLPKPKENTPEPYGIALDYEAQVVVRNEGGTLEVQDGQLLVSKADAVTVLLDAGTDYVNRREQGWRGAQPHEAITQRLQQAAARPYDELLGEHLRDYQALFNRLSLELGATPEALRRLPTDQRRAACQSAWQAAGWRSPFEQSALPPGTPAPDPGLEALLFQYARYLMISSSRPGDLPANLQGVWNEYNHPAWRSDYHTDVNVQMNYWFVDMANLPGCFEPLAEWLKSIIPVRREATRKAFNVRGWATRSENGIFGGATYHWVPGDAAWVAQNIWDHYAFSQDRHYLETSAYPILKELCEFWEDFLIVKPDGMLVSPRSQSPEHGPWAEGNSYEQQLVYDLFTNYIQASRILGRDEAFRAKIAAMRERLLGPKIGKWGQLQEWAVDRDDPKDHHRHTAHLIAVFPGRQITPATTPELAKAAAVSLAARGEDGDSRREWAWVWRCAIWGRLGQGERAHHQLIGLISYNTFGNLWMTHPPFQIDGSFGYAAGVGEMLLQSHESDPNGDPSRYLLRLLPALPKAWPNGQVRGLVARGGFTIDMAWREGKLTAYQVHSAQPREVTVVVDAVSKVVRSSGR
jgi:alpha-L-fucosidase 2